MFGGQFGEWVSEFTGKKGRVANKYMDENEITLMWTSADVLKESIIYDGWDATTFNKNPIVQIVCVGNENDSTGQSRMT